MTTQEEMQTYLSELIQKTKNGTAEWKMVNPTTYTWLRPIEAILANVVIQRYEMAEVKQGGDAVPPIPILKRTIHYRFQITELPANTQMISLNTQEQPAYMPLLSELFSTIQEAVSRKGLDFFKKLMQS